MTKFWITIAAAGIVAGCSGSEPHSSAVQPSGGERLRVEAAQLPLSKPVAGEITTRKQADALARIPGILVELKVREGDDVVKGQLIGRIVETRLGYETGAYEAQVAAAAAQAENARAELHRIKYLYDRGFYAKARLDEAEAAARSADAQVTAARSQHSASAALAGEGAVLAPATGRVLRADVPAGSPVTSGMSLATITAGPPVVRVEVPQSLIDQLRVGARITIQDDSELSGRRGTVVEVYPAMSGGRVRADVELPGLTANFVGRRISALLNVGSRTTVAVPRRFVRTRFGVDYVDLLEKDGSAAWVPVQTAPTGDAVKLEILSGVSPGDVLLVARSPE